MAGGDEDDEEGECGHSSTSVLGLWYLARVVKEADTRRVPADQELPPNGSLRPLRSLRFSKPETLEVGEVGVAWHHPRARCAVFVDGTRMSDSKIIVFPGKNGRRADFDSFLLAMFLMFARAPKKATPDVDGSYSLGEIGTAPEK